MDYRAIGLLASKYETDDFHVSISNQLLKMQEELGEAAQAYIGVIGQNPRKGVTHTYQDLANEIVDVVLTGLVALTTVLGPINWTDVEGFFEKRVATVIERGLAHDEQS